MKMIILSEDHYIVVDDSEIKGGDWIGFLNLEKFVPVQYLGGDLTGYEKRITHSTQPIEEWKSVNYGGDGTVKKKIYNKIKELPLQEVKELLGVVDVEKQVDDYGFQVPYDGSNNFYDKEKMKHYLAGYNQALEDNKERKYTEEDITEAILRTIDACNEAQKNSYGELEIDEEAIIQSLQPKTEWDVEFDEHGKLTLV